MIISSLKANTEETGPRNFIKILETESTAVPIDNDDWKMMELVSTLYR